MHGQWSMDIQKSGVADFLADMTMSDYGTTNNVLDATKGGQNAHTHHIRLTNIAVTWNMTWLPRIPQTGYYRRLSSDNRHSQSDHRKWERGPLRDDAADNKQLSGLRHRRNRSHVFQHDDGLCGTCYEPFRDAAYSWRRTEGIVVELAEGPRQSSISLSSLDDYARPSRFCASTSPRGVGRKMHDTKPSASSENAASRTTFRCELASCIRISPVERICGR